MNLEGYFRRIGYQGEAAADLKTLRALHALHPLAIPFENLSPFSGEAVTLGGEDLERKLLGGGRGGYCYEQNLLFASVLRTLGFPVRGLAARVLWNVPAGAALPRTHMLLAVEAQGGTWLADVGFGGLTATAPLVLEDGAVQATPHEPMRLEREGEDWLLRARVGEGWKALYRFDLQEQQWADYDLANWYVSTHPDSRFVNQLIAARPDHGCRHALLNREYRLHRRDGASERRELDDPKQILSLLEEVFGLDTAALPGLESRLNSLFP